jgi:hypothetical protein
LIVTNTFVEYKEKNPRTNQAGKVQFHEVHATINNLTNHRDAIKEKKIMTADITTKFLNKALLKVVWTFYLRHPRGKFNVLGNMDGMNFKDANFITEPMGPATMEDGRLANLQFIFSGDDYGVTGTVKMLYDDLKYPCLKETGEVKN